MSLNRKIDQNSDLLTFTKVQLRELVSKLAPPQDVVRHKLPGLSVHMITTIYTTKDERRKYILDIGKEESEHLSIYLDASNVLTFMILDQNGEPHSVRVPSGKIGVPLNELVYLNCEIGLSGNATSLRVSINGLEADTLHLPFKLKPGSLSLEGGVVGANVNGEFGAKIDMVEFLAYAQTLTSEEQSKLFEYFEQKIPTHLIRFEEKD